MRKGGEGWLWMKFLTHHFKTSPSLDIEFTRAPHTTFDSAGLSFMAQSVACFRPMLLLIYLFVSLPMLFCVTFRKILRRQLLRTSSHMIFWVFRFLVLYSHLLSTFIFVWDNPIKKWLSDTQKRAFSKKTHKWTTAAWSRCSSNHHKDASQGHKEIPPWPLEDG